MKILFLFNNDDRYGAGKSSLKLVEELNKYEDVQPIVVTPFKNRNNKFCNDNGIENYSIPYFEETLGNNTNFFKKSVKKLVSRIVNGVFLLKIDNKINFNEIDIIHTCVAGNLNGQRLSEKYNIRHVWHLRDLPITWKYFNDRQFEKMGKSNTTFISISNYVNDYWKQLGISSQTVYNGIDPSTIKYTKNTKQQDKRKEIINIVFGSGLVEHKNPEIIIRAVANLSIELRRKLHIDFYGSAKKKYAHYLTAMVKENNLEEIIDFKGYSEDINNLLTDYDIGIMSSFSEPFGRITIEYMLAGLYVLGSNTGANPELIDQNSGRLFDINSPNQLKEEITFLITHPNEINRSRKISRPEAIARFSSDKNAKEIHNLYFKNLAN